MPSSLCPRDTQIAGFSPSSLLPATAAFLSWTARPAPRWPALTLPLPDSPRSAEYTALPLAATPPAAPRMPPSLLQGPATGPAPAAPQHRAPAAGGQPSRPAPTSAGPRSGLGGPSAPAVSPRLTDPNSGHRSTPGIIFQDKVLTCCCLSPSRTSASKARRPGLPGHPGPGAR